MTSRQLCHDNRDDVITRRRRVAVDGNTTVNSPSPPCTVCSTDQLSLLPSAAVDQQRRYAITSTGSSSPCRTVDERRRYPIELQRPTGTGNSLTSENDDGTRRTEVATVGGGIDRVHRRRRRTAFTNEQVIMVILIKITIIITRMEGKAQRVAARALSPTRDNLLD